MIGAALVAMIAAGTACTAGGEFEPPLCPTGLARVAAVRTQDQGQTLWKEAAPAPPCDRFRLSEAQVKRFFRLARKADPRAVHFTLPESPCVVRGTARFADGSHGVWQIDQFALGWLDRPRHPRMTLYCKACGEAPWSQ
jgi:hypothetical protein